MTSVRFRSVDVLAGAEATIKRITEERARFRERSIAVRYAIAKKLHRYVGRYLRLRPPTPQSIREKYVPADCARELWYAWGTLHDAYTLKKVAEKAIATGIETMRVSALQIDALTLPLRPELKKVEDDELDREATDEAVSKPNLRLGTKPTLGSFPANLGSA